MMNSRFFLYVFFNCLMLGVSGVVDQRAIYAEATHEQQLDDAQIVNIMMTVNKAEITAAEDVLKRNVSPAVKDYAKTLLQQHETNQKQLLELTKQLGIEPKESPISNDVEKGGKEDLTSIEKLEGPAFDKAYINAMVKEHQGGLKVIETKLFPQATNPQLKAFVDKFRNMVYSHFEKGLQLQRNLANPPR